MNGLNFKFTCWSMRGGTGHFWRGSCKNKYFASSRAWKLILKLQRKEKGGVAPHWFTFISVFAAFTQGLCETVRPNLPRQHLFNACWFLGTTLRTLHVFSFFLSFFLFFFFFCLLGLHLWHMEVPRLGAYTTATAMPGPNRICPLHHSSWQYWILDP